MLFSIAGAGPASLKVNGTEWLWRAPRPAFWRASTDNDRGCGFPLRAAAWMAADVFVTYNGMKVLDADHQQNQHGGKILQNGAHTGAGKLDGQKVSELAKADASQAIDHKVARVAPAAPGVHQLAPVAHTVIDAQNHTGQKQPDGHQPGGIHALAGKQILPHAAGNTPAHAAEHCQQSAFYAIRHSL